MSWSDRLTGRSLEEALTLTGKFLMGGLWARGPLTKGSEIELENEIISAISQSKGRRLILANGCSVPDDTPEEWLHLARRLIDKLSHYDLFSRCRSTSPRVAQREACSSEMTPDLASLDPN